MLVCVCDYGCGEPGRPCSIFQHGLLGQHPQVAEGLHRRLQAPTQEELAQRQGTQALAKRKSPSREVCEASN